ncbi:MAG: transketolase, partial [Chloroflexi bacterium]|nr:transketolase [Chloroflexota bacterium]
DAALRRARGAPRPLAIVAKTQKGAGVSFLANKDAWHGKALDAEQAKAALAELGDPQSRTFQTRKPADGAVASPERGAASLPAFKDALATRKAYGESLAALAAVDRAVVVLDAEVSNSTHAEDVKKTAPERFVEMYIAEQQMVAAAVGMQALGLVPFASTFAAFLTRAYDFVRMAAISRASIRLCGSHAGVSIGEDGPSQMALEDLAMMRAVHGSTVLYPCDANQTAQLVAAMATTGGISYLRSTREKTPLVYAAGETFPIGGSKVVRKGDRATVVAAGITLHESLKAADVLAKEGIAIRVIDAYSVKPIDAATLAAAVRETGRIVVVEDHWPEGGLGSAVLEAVAGERFAFRHLAPRKMPGSAKPLEELDDAGISAAHIVAAVNALL